jgi:hypothetical protein
MILNRDNPTINKSTILSNKNNNKNFSYVNNNNNSSIYNIIE